MADLKITDYTALTGGNMATSDLLEIVDVSDTTFDTTGTNKKSTLQNLIDGLIALGALTRKYSGALTGGATTEVVTHNLNTRDVLVAVINNADPYDEVVVTKKRTTVNTVTIEAGDLLPAGYRVVVIG
jgi:hypothetical protein